MSAPAYTYPTTPTAISATASEGIFTALQLAADIPQVRRQLMARHNMKDNFFTMMREMGLGSPLMGPECAHWEEDWIINNFLVGSIVTASTGAGTNIIVALDATSMYTTTVPGSGTSRYSYPAQWDLVFLPDGTHAQIIYKDVTTNPHRLTIRPIDSTVDLAGKIVANGRYWIGTDAFGEGTYGATPKIPRVYRWSNNTQIIKSAFVETGSSMTNKMPFMNIEGMEGSLMILGAEATEKLQYDRISKALWFGKQGDGNVTVTSDATGQTVGIKTTQGLDDYIETNGNLLTYPSSGFDLDSFDAIGEVFQRELISSKNIIMPMAYGVHSQINNTLKDYMDNTAFAYAVASGAFKSDIFNGFTDPKDFFLWLTFSGLSKNGFNFLLKNQPELTEVMGAATTGYNWNTVAYALPVESFRNKDGSNALQPSLGYRYKSLGGYSREYEVGYTGGAGNKPKTSSLDASAMDVRSEIAGEWALGNHMIKLTQDAS